MKGHSKSRPQGAASPQIPGKSALQGSGTLWPLLGKSHLHFPTARPWGVQLKIQIPGEEEDFRDKSNNHRPLVTGGNWRVLLPRCTSITPGMGRDCEFRAVCL